MLPVWNLRLHNKLMLVKPLHCCAEGGGSQQGQIASQLWERSLGRLLNRSDRFWASTIEAQPSDEPLPVSRPIRPDEELDQEPFVTVASQDDSSRSDRSELLEQTYEGSQPDSRSHDSSTQADAEDSIAAKEVRELEAEVSTEGQKELRPDPKVRTTPSDIQARKRLGDLIPGLDPEAGNQNTGQVPGELPTLYAWWQRYTTFLSGL